MKRRWHNVVRDLVLTVIIACIVLAVTHLLMG